MYFTSDVIATDSSYFGQGNGSISLHNVQCTGNKASIFSCSHSSIESHNYGCSEDAGVVCPEGDYSDCYSIMSLVSCGCYTL